MADKESSQTSAPVARSNRSMSELLLNEKWDHCISSGVIRAGLGVSFGIVFSVLLFKRRAWPAWVGLGFGVGRAYEECDNSFKKAATPTKDGLRVIRP